MTSVVPFAPSHADQLVALWRGLHPDWTWLDDPEGCAKIIGPSDAVAHIGYVVRRQEAVIASVFGTCSRDHVCSPDQPWPRNRFICIEARPEEVAAEWLDTVLAAFIDADRGHPGTWHVADASEALQPVLAPLLETAGFVRHSSTMQMEWNGEFVTGADPGPARLERYAGGNPELDRAIVDLHNSAYRPLRLVPPADLASLWKPWPGQQAREFVLAVEDDRQVGYAEWCVIDGKPYISSFVVARSHWGTAVATGLLTGAMQMLRDRGHRKIEAMIRSNNAASLRLARKHGWNVASELAQTFVRRL